MANIKKGDLVQVISVGVLLVMRFEQRRKKLAALPF
jgi:hypothetical protein